MTKKTYNRNIGHNVPHGNRAQTNMPKINMERLHQRSFTNPGEVVIELRGMRGESQREFSQQMNVSIYTIQKWEQGVRIPSNRNKSIILKLANKHDKL